MKFWFIMIFYFDFDLFIHFYFFSVTSGTPRKKAYTGSVFDCEWFPKLLSNDITNKYIITKVKQKKKIHAKCPIMNDTQFMCNFYHHN